MGALLPAGMALALLTMNAARGQQILQYGFETRGPVWQQGSADAKFSQPVHRLTDETAHGGQRSEHIRLTAEKGTHIDYTYDVGRAPINDELNVSLWLKSTRPGIQLLCRVVLPYERDPNNIGQPRTLMLRCEPYQSTRWKLVTLRQPVKRLQEQQQLLRHQLGRDVVTADAYIDRLVLNVYDGPGLIDVWIDDLEVGPVYDSRPPGMAQQPSAAQPGGKTSATPTANSANQRTAEVELRGNQLFISHQPFFLMGIRHTGTPLKTLRDAGFNTVWIDESSPDGLIEDAVNLGFWLVPMIHPPRLLVGPGGRLEATLVSSQDFTHKVSRFLDQDAVLCWDLGSNLGAERFSDIAHVARAFRASDPTRPVSADVWDGFGSYSKSLDQLLLGVHRWPLLTSLELTSYRDWLLMRKHLAAPDTFCWTWVQTHLPEWFLETAYDNTGGAIKEPVGPQAEQIRLLAYTAIGCGYRGLAFWSDRFLADSHTGRDRLLGLAQLNQELRLLEPLLVKATKEPTWIDTSMAGVVAAVIRIPGEAVLVLPMAIGFGAQFVPGQSAIGQLDITVPQVPDTAQAWEVSPGGIRSYKTQRVLGGTRISLHNFSLTSAIVFTSDLSPTGLVVRLQEQQRNMGKIAAQWAHDEAQEELTKVEQVNAELEKVGHRLDDAAGIVKRAHESLKRCEEYRRNGEYSDAHAEAQVVLRAARVLMRAHWEKAVRDIDSPVSSPYAVSFFTLPRHWRFVDDIRTRHPGKNVLPGGDFETPPTELAPGWVVPEVPSLDAVVQTTKRVADNPKTGKQCLLLSIQPKDKLLIPQALERTFLAVNSPEVKLKPGTLVRVSAWIKVPSVGASTDGAMFYDSAGGEPLALRLSVTPGGAWKHYSLFRRVPASGTLKVTLALTGLGTAYFDDVRIEPLEGEAPSRPAQEAPAKPPAQRTGPTVKADPVR
jgi:hypothetical protein